MRAFFESIGLGSEQRIDPVHVAVKSGAYSSIPYPRFSYKLNIPISDNIPAGIYKTVATVTLRLPDGASAGIGGFYEAPIIQVYEG